MLLPLLQNNLLTGAAGGVVANLSATDAPDTLTAAAGIALSATGAGIELGDSLVAVAIIGEAAEALPVLERALSSGLGRTSINLSEYLRLYGTKGMPVALQKPALARQRRARENELFALM